MSFKYIAFFHKDGYQAQHNTKGAEYKIYTLKGRFYVDNHNGETGFTVEDVEKYSHAFLFGNSIKEIQASIKEALYAQKYGDGKSGDVQCTVCGRWHSFEPYREWEGLNESFSEIRECLCGKKFRAKVKVEIKWDVENLN